MKSKANRFLRSSSLFSLLATTIVVQLGASNELSAASQTWTGTTNSNWSTTTNWSNSLVPGSTTNAQNNDVATFNIALTNGGTRGGSTDPVLIDTATLNIGGIVFSGASVGAYQIGTNAGNALFLSPIGIAYGTHSISLAASTGAPQVIAAPLKFTAPSSTNGSFGFVNNAGSSVATITLSGAITANSSGSRPSILILDGSNIGNNLISGAITSPGQGQLVPLLVKAGAGTWTLSNANSFTGTAMTDTATTNYGIQILDGTLVAGNNNALGTSGTANANQVYIGNKSTTWIYNAALTTTLTSSLGGGTLQIANGITLDNGMSLNLINGGTIRGVGAAATNGRVNLAATANINATVSTVSAGDVFTIGNGANDLTGGLDTTSVLHIAGLGTVINNASSTNFLGSIAIDAGAFRTTSVTNGAGINGVVTFGLNSTGKLQIANNLGLTSLTTNGSSLTAGTVEASTGSQTLTLTTTGTNSFGGVLQNGAGTLGLAKTGAGTLTLTGTNTYTGATAINNGTLNILGSLASGSAVAANTGGTLAGTGTVAGTVSVASNGRIAPGNAGIGNLTLGALTLGVGSQLDYDITNTSSLDRITVSNSGGLTLNGGQLNINGGTSPFTANGVYNLIGYSGALGGTGIGALSVNATNQDLANKSYSFSSNGSFIILTISNAAAVASFWNADADGNWSTGPWTAATPNAVGAFAGFGGGGTEITANRTIAVNSAFTVGTISLNGAANNKTYTLANGGGSLTLDNGATTTSLSNTAGSNTIASSVILTTNGVTTTVTLAADTLTLSGVVSGTGAMTKAGAGKLALTGTNTFVGNTTINAGTIQINSPTSLGDAANTVTINSATLQAIENISTSRNITVGDAASVISVDATKTYSVGGGVSGGGALNKSGGGTLALTGTNTYSGGTVIKAGTLSVSNDLALGAVPGAPAINITFDPGAGNTATLQFGNFSPNVSRSILFNSGTGAIDTQANTVTLTGASSGSGILSKTGSGILIVGSAQGYTGGTVVNGGTLRIRNGGSVQNGITLNNGTTLSLISSAGGVGVSNAVTVSGTATITADLLTDFSTSLFTGTSSDVLTIGNGGAGVNFASNNVKQFQSFLGTVNLLSGSTIDERFNGTWTSNGGDNTTFVIDGYISSKNGNNGTWHLGALSSIGTTGNLAGTTTSFTVGAKGIDSVYGGVITTTATTGLTKVGAGKLTLTNSGNTYTGTTVISVGKLEIGNGGSTGTLGNGGLVTDNASLIFNRSDAAYTVTNVINGTGTLTQNGTGTLTLASTGSGYAGVTTINNGGTININSVWQLGGGFYGGLTFGATGGTLQYATTLMANNATDLTQDTSINNIDTGNAKNVTLTGNATIDTNGNNVSYKNTFGNSGAGSLTKIGNGTLTLAGTSTYTGATAVNGGTLSVTGSIAALSAVAVGPSGTLAGTGTVNGPVAGAGTIAPGVSNAGTLTTGAATLAGTLAIDVDGATGDQLVSTGAITGTTTVTVSLLAGGFTQASYVIAQGTSITASFTAPSGYSVTIESGGTQAVLRQAAVSGYNTWASTGFGLNPLTDGAPAFDKENDGFANAAEYIFGGSPISGSDNPKVYSFITDTDGDTLNELVMTIAVPQGTPAFSTAAPSSSGVTTDGFTIEVRGSTDLNTFATTVIPITPVITGLPTVSGLATGAFTKGGVTYDYRSFRLNDSNGTPNKGFLQARVVIP